MSTDAQAPETPETPPAPPAGPTIIVRPAKTPGPVSTPLARAEEAE